MLKYCFLGFDPGTFLNQLNNLQANQIDDLESALLPHLHGNFTQITSYIIYCSKKINSSAMIELILGSNL